MNKFKIDVLVSIIIPVFNREESLKETLDSVIAQSFKNWECIMVDDGSTDKSLELCDDYVKKDHRFKVYTRNRLPKGAPTCRNIGLKASKGDYIIFLDSDDYLLNHCLDDRVAFAQQFDQCLFWIFPMGIKNNKEIVIKNIPKDKDYLIEFLSYRLHWQTMCVFWSRNTIIELNGFRENFPRFNDPELMIRGFLLANNNYKINFDSSYDSVFQPDVKNIRKFKNKVYDSILVFLPNIIDDLDQSGKSDLKKHLIEYLNGWFRSISKPLYGTNYFQDIKLVWCFYKNRILTKKGLLERIWQYSVFSLIAVLKMIRRKLIAKFRKTT